MRAKQYGKRILSEVGDMCRVASGFLSYYPHLRNQNLLILSIHTSRYCTRYNRGPVRSSRQVALVLMSDFRTMEINLSDLVSITKKSKDSPEET